MISTPTGTVAGSVASSATWQASGLGERRSHGQRELAECGRDAERWCGVGGEFVVAAADVLDEACPAAITSADRKRVSPHIGRSRAFSRA
jgi:hypothetical protein